MDQKVRLYKTAKERRRYEDMADLYAVVKTTQHLEKAYIRDCVNADEYTEACSRLISQFKTNEKALDGINTLDFINEYTMDCPLAVERLLTAGVPATVMHSTGRVSKDKNAAVIAAEATQEFITAMDVLRLNQTAVDEVQPVISSLLNSLNKAESVAPEFDKSKIQEWLVTLNKLRASEDLNDDQVRQLLLDLDTSYASFKSSLK